MSLQPKLHAHHLTSLSEGLRIIAPDNYIGKIFVLVLSEIKIKVDHKLASGFIPHNGCSLKLSPAQLEAATVLLKLVNKHSKDVELSNALGRLIGMNLKRGN